MFEDHFDGPAGTLPDPAKWAFDTGRGYTQADGTFADGWGNFTSEVEYQTADNARLDGASNLVIKLKREATPDADPDPARQFTGARVNTDGRFRARPPCRIEIRAKFPPEVGATTALWTLGGPVEPSGNHNGADRAIQQWPLYGELDIVETRGSYQRNDELFFKSWQNLKTPDPDFAAPYPDQYVPWEYGDIGFNDQQGASVYDDFHVVALEWREDSLKWFWDGSLRFTSTREDADAANQEWPWGTYYSQYILMQITANDWAGSFPLPGFTEADLLIDYVRVTAL